MSWDSSMSPTTKTITSPGHVGVDVDVDAESLVEEPTETSLDIELHLEDFVDAESLVEEPTETSLDKELHLEDFVDAESLVEEPTKTSLDKELHLEDLVAIHHKGKPNNRNLVENSWVYISSHLYSDELFLNDYGGWGLGPQLGFGTDVHTKYFVKPSPKGGYVLEYNNKCVDNNYSDRIAMMHPCHGGNNQNWYFYGDDWSNVEIKSGHDWTCLNLDGHIDFLESWSWSTALLWTCHGGSNQRFSMTLA
jgi:hypothetical protein